MLENAEAAVPDPSDAILADERQPDARAALTSAEHAVIDPMAWWSLAPVGVFWVARQFVSSQAAIGAGFATAVVVFALHRRREKGVLAWLALAGLVIVSASALAGVVLDSEKAFLANDPVGDGITVLVALGSLVIGRPIVGVVACEVFPRWTRHLRATDTVFVQLTLLLAAKDFTTGVARIFLLDSLDTDGYIIFSRLVSWPLNALFFYAAYSMVLRANRRARLAGGGRPTADAA